MPMQTVNIAGPWFISSWGFAGLCFFPRYRRLEPGAIQFKRMNVPEWPEVYYTYTKHILSGNLRSEQLLVRHQLGHLTLNWPSCWNFASRSWRSVKSGVPKIHKVYLHGFNTSKVYAWMNNCMDFTNLMYSNYSRLENNVQWINQCQSFMYNWSWGGFSNIIFTYPIFQGLTSAKSTTSLVI